MITFPDHPRDLPDGECHAPAGYCAGLLLGSDDWLTVLGSAYDYVPLFATPERAEAWAQHKGWTRAHDWAEHVTRWVERRGDYFRLSEPPAPLAMALPPGTRCAWFAKCDREATHIEPHPVLSGVPACDRCPQIGR